ncbi:monothiol glutaredoxin-S12, chloroplastic isoform X1 [Dendrobium catenatum]|uniref:Monothiol glutaredoxin-S12, chloroplastic n=1 Tax=Dendrobium catenatum TaxID=906689 RepID=A0A2I0VPB0_9ASPA|nr:monothiol glutaredoxin-S12, chloroplastic isoform X2 [Dendrobium catenatum]XP_020684900.1 monothiol glutaredoxin-S12, chloroplastic isoform X1 [Dendrobium catenatum]PKU65232.1 Monothiol glutaredoxin-S12, chloroplastic [Dendrobium catenatum]
MASSTVQLSGLQSFYLRCHSSSHPQLKTLALPLASSPAYCPEVSSLRSVLRRSRRRRHVFVRYSVSGKFFVNSTIKKLSETNLVPIPSGSEGIEGLFPAGAGVYGVYDKNGDLQFIGISRNVVASITAHSKTVPVLCSSVKVGLIDGDNPDKTVLTDAWKSWLEEHLAITGKIPPGNQSGNNTWVRKPQTKPDLRLTRGRHVQLSVSLEELIDRLVKENEVVAFIKGSRSAPQCGFSQRVIGILESHGVNFESVDVLDEEHNYGLRETLKKYSNWPTFPQVFVRGELVGGCDIISSMAEKGELAALFNK